MKETRVPFWLAALVIQGREGDDDEGGSDEGNDSEDNSEEGENEDEEGGDGGEGADDDEDLDEDDPKALKLALARERKKAKDERRLRRKAERDARRAKSKDEEDADEKEAEKARKRAEAADSKVTRLADKLLRQSRDAAILEAARNAGFIDPSDALTDTIRNAVEYDQDDDDPSDIEIDEDSVEEAVTKYAKKKQHLVGKGTDTSTRSGSRRGKRKSSDDLDEKVLESNYNI